MTTQEILIRANEAKTALTLADTARKNQALHRMADALEKPDHRARILEANQRDLEAAKGTISEVMLDRLMLNPGGCGAGRSGWESVVRNRTAKRNDHPKNGCSNGRDCDYL